MATEKLQLYKCEVCGNLVQVAPRQRDARHPRQPGRRGRGRAVRMDGNVQRVRPNRQGGGVHRAGGPVRSSGENRKEPRGAVQ